jgi:hypothetical protein
MIKSRTLVQVAVNFGQLFGHPAADLDYWMTKPDKRHLFQKDWFYETGLRTVHSHLAEFSGMRCPLVHSFLS